MAAAGSKPALAAMDLSLAFGSSRSCCLGLRIPHPTAQGMYLMNVYGVIKVLEEKCSSISPCEFLRQKTAIKKELFENYFSKSSHVNPYQQMCN